MAKVASWMGAQSRYDGPSLDERKRRRQNGELCVYVRLSKLTSKVGLRRALEGKGAVVSDIRIVYRNGNSTGVAYVDVKDESSLQIALRTDGMNLDGEKIYVKKFLNAQSLKKLVSRKEADSSTSTEAKKNKSGKIPSATTAPRAKVKICFAFQKGNCRFGSNCKFSHENGGAKKKVPASKKNAPTSTGKSDKGSTEKRARPSKNTSVISAENVDVESLLAQREAARKSRDFVLADKIRDKLVSMGVRIRDQPLGKRKRQGKKENSKFR